MSAQDDRDPLHQWLNQEVRPLPPPPGTFALIKARARRRKLRKLAVTVASAAAVAAAVVIAAPKVVSLRLTPSATGSAVAAAGQPSAARVSVAPQGSATRDVTAKPAVSPSAPAGVPAGPVPANFQPSSVTFVSPQAGWVIGQAGTPGQCANADPDICTSIARTDDGGKTWQGSPAPDTAGPSGPAGVSGIRFLDGINGWAFGPELWATHDGGAHWIRIDTHGQRVTELETVSGRAYALFATCSGPSTTSFAAGCTSFTLMTAAADSNAWEPAGGSTNGLTGGDGGAASAAIALSGPAGYLLAPDGTIYAGPIGGAWRPVASAPCRPGVAQASGAPAAAFLALVSSTRLALACAGPTATSPPEIFTSGTGGASWTRSAAAWHWPDFGAVTSLAAAPDGTLVLATTRGLYVLAAGGSRWQASTASGAKAPRGGFSYAGLTTNTQGVAVPADTALHQIWMTFDGGRTWAPAAAIGPGS